MENVIKVGEIIKVEVIGTQHYGIFIKSLDDQTYSGLIHISEISNEYVKDVNDFAKIGDIMYAKVLDVDNNTKHIKLSIKAMNSKTRYKQSPARPKCEEIYSDFKPLEERLNGWIHDQLKEKRKHD